MMNKIEVLIEKFGVEQTGPTTFKKDRLIVKLYKGLGCNRVPASTLNEFISYCWVTFYLDENVEYKEFFEFRDILKDNYYGDDLQLRINNLAKVLLVIFLRYDYFNKKAKELKDFYNVKDGNCFSLLPILEKKIDKGKFKVYSLNHKWEKVFNRVGRDNIFTITSECIYFIKYDEVIVNDNYLASLIPKSYITSYDETGYVNTLIGEGKKEIRYENELTKEFILRYDVLEHSSLLNCSNPALSDLQSESTYCEDL